MDERFELTPLNYTNPLFSSSQEEFVVHSILGYRRDQETGQDLFLVRWEGYPVEESTWEPWSCLTNCNALVQEFLSTRLSQVRRCTELLLQEAERLQAAMWWSIELSENTMN